MSRGIVAQIGMIALAGALAFSPGAGAQTAAAPAENAALTDDNAILLTIFLKHDQSRPLSELIAQAERQGFFKAFPPNFSRVRAGRAASAEAGAVDGGTR